MSQWCVMCGGTGGEVGRIDFLPVRGMEGIKTATVEVNNRVLKLAVVNGLGNTEKLISMIKSKKFQLMWR